METRQSKRQQQNQQRQIPQTRKLGIPIEETEKETSDVETKNGWAVRKKLYQGREARAKRCLWPYYRKNAPKGYIWQVTGYPEELYPE